LGARRERVSTCNHAAARFFRRVLLLVAGLFCLPVAGLFSAPATTRRDERTTLLEIFFFQAEPDIDPQPRHKVVDLVRRRALWGSLRCEHFSCHLFGISYYRLLSVPHLPPHALFQRSPRTKKGALLIAKEPYSRTLPLQALFKAVERRGVLRRLLSQSDELHLPCRRRQRAEARRRHLVSQI
jgi:hypothetical protein